ncbi:thiopurine S-methyltransferase [Robbsia sp. Bb-Pol-6]|uniref:Thiopurine S-methyltransferase n=1 Tax=Robbsia betulipollinis TaxID=2981849 RepID=A0ABT3ZII5_9BURK|nr:thiopurine S-methyltransferase [Robbsia betulipollinis]MCY0386130.1 thiopurine S-methyltransferase [Robbsia betulipollinis]
MDADFWLERWRDGRTHFHQDHVMPDLPAHWPALELAPGTQVLVPLCGKSLDMLWLAERGHAVLGVELSALAVEQFFAENGLRPTRHASPQGERYRAGNIEIIRGDIFALDAAHFADCAAIYDRAALIALPPAMQQHYVAHVYGQLAATYRGLLITLDYPQAQRAGPPFSLPEASVQALFAPQSSAREIARADILAAEPAFAARGVTCLDSVVYRMQRRAHDVSADTRPGT